MAALLLCLAASCSGTAPAADGGAAHEPLPLGREVARIEGSETSGSAFAYASEQAMLDAMKPICENEWFSLRYSPDTLAIAVVNKATGDIFTSNPYAASLDPSYSGQIAGSLSSQVVLSYLDSDTRILKLFSSTDCAELGQYTIIEYENGLAVEMSIGKEKDKEIVPLALTPERYQQLHDSLSGRMQARFEMYYTFFSKDEVTDSGLLEAAPAFVLQDVYYCQTQLSDKEKETLSEALIESGYTAQQFEADNAALGISESAESFPNFKITLQYCLTDDGLEVCIPNESIVNNEEYPLLNIALLPYFGAESPTAAGDGDGYLFIPDGSGAAIAIDGQPENRRIVMSGRVYGTDGSRMKSEEIGDVVQPYYLPVFGLVRHNGSGLFAILKDGDAACDIFANLGQPNGNYYTVYPSFECVNYELYTSKPKIISVNSGKTLYLYDKNFTDADFRLSYYFLAGEDASYTGMAHIYRDYLIRRGMNERTPSKNAMHLETLGSALSEHTLLGFSYDAETPFTTYSQNVQILETLAGCGVTDVSLELKGWSQKGLDAGVSNKLRLSGALGSRADLQALADYCRGHGVGLTTDNSVSYARFDRAFDGFRRGQAATRDVNLEYAQYAELQPDTLTYGDSGYVVSPRYYAGYIQGLLEGYTSLGIPGIGLGELGSSLNSNFDREDSINRAQAKRFVEEALEAVDEELSLSFEGANAYILPYAELLTEIPYTNSGFVGETASVPFLQLVVDGSMQCCSQPVNLADDLREQLLLCLQSGTAPTFQLSYDNTEVLKLTDHTNYYAVDFQILRDTIVESYAYLEPAIAAVQGSRLSGHRILADGVVEASFESGAEIVVNLSDAAYTGEGLTVASMSYAVK